MAIRFEDKPESKVKASGKSVAAKAAPESPSPAEIADPSPADELPFGYTDKAGRKAKPKRKMR